MAQQVAACLAVLLAARLMPLPDARGQIAHLPAFCPFYRMTGIPCPGCGMTRSLVCLMHGRWFEAWQYHPLGWLVAASLVGCIVLNSVDIFRATPCITVPPQIKAMLPIAGCLILLGVWAARLNGWDALTR